MNIYLSDIVLFFCNLLIDINIGMAAAANYTGNEHNAGYMNIEPNNNLSIFKLIDYNPRDIYVNGNLEKINTNNRDQYRIINRIEKKGRRPNEFYVSAFLVIHDNDLYILIHKPIHDVSENIPENIVLEIHWKLISYLESLRLLPNYTIIKSLTDAFNNLQSGQTLKIILNTDATLKDKLLNNFDQRFTNTTRKRTHSNRNNRDRRTRRVSNNNNSNNNRNRNRNNNIKIFKSTGIDIPLNTHESDNVIFFDHVRIIRDHQDEIIQQKEYERQLAELHPEPEVELLGTIIPAMNALAEGSQVQLTPPRARARAREALPVAAAAAAPVVEWGATPNESLQTPTAPA